MVCVRCGMEHDVDVVKVWRSRSAAGKQTLAADSRLVRCLNCDFVWCEESRVAYVSVYNPVTRQRSRVTVDEYNELWRKRDEVHPKILRLFDFSKFGDNE